MDITPISVILQTNNYGLPTINALIPNIENYNTFIFQPNGAIEASSNGVRNIDRVLANQQFSAFLHKAKQNESDLVICPEYSMPWDVLINLINADIVPSEGKIWVLGCESIKYSELVEVFSHISTKAELLYEHLEPNNNRFVDPLVYVFNASSLLSNASRLILVVQFKTHPMGDADHFEINNLQVGTVVYKFGGQNDQLSLFSLICSDVFNFQDTDAAANHDRALIIHIQLNRSPRHALYRQYRDKLLQFRNDATELICVNWARNVNEKMGEKSACWNNISGSAWYLKSIEFDFRDQTLCDNHKRGLYYTWFENLRSHVLFFNYEPGAYLLNASKVVHIGVVAPASRRRGPQLTNVYVWDSASNNWSENNQLDDGFLSLIAESGNAKDELVRIANQNPFNVERILALTTGNHQHFEDWHIVKKLDSLGIDSGEVIYRMTFCQDSDDSASSFRIRRLKRCGILWDIIQDKNNLPTALVDLSNGFNFTWSSNSPHQNAISSTGKLATLIYLGEDVSRSEIEKTSTKMAAIIQRQFENPDDSHTARQRLAVWYRDQEGKIVQHNRYQYVDIANGGATSEINLGRES